MENDGIQSLSDTLAERSTAVVRVGGTGKQTSKQVKRWCATLNNFTEEEYGSVKQLTEKVPALQWLIAGREYGTELGTLHLQMYMVFKRSVRFEFVRNIFPRAHWEPAKASHKANYEYCTKDGDVIELGERPDFDVKQKQGEAEKNRWEDARDRAKAGDFENIDAQILVQYTNNILKINANFGDKPKALDLEKFKHKQRFRWFYGPAGSGKTRSAIALSPPENTYLKMINKWWDGYEGQAYVIIDDLAVKDDYMGHFLKIWCDVNPFRAETKGGSKLIRPEFITVTSNWHPHEIWTDEKVREPIDRRFGVTYIGPPGKQYSPFKDREIFVMVPRPETPAPVTPPNTPRCEACPGAPKRQPECAARILGQTLGQDTQDTIEITDDEEESDEDVIMRERFNALIDETENDMIKSGNINEKFNEYKKRIRN